MTGMPAFSDHLGETKMWQVTMLVKNADKISPAVKQELTALVVPTTAPATPPLMPPASSALPSQTAPPEAHK